MTVDEVMNELESYGNPATKKVLLNHGAREPFFGVKVADLKKIVKKVKKDHELSLELYKTGNSDAMYLAGLISDEDAITKEDLQEWVENAYWYYIAEYTVPWVAAMSKYGLELAKEWIESSEDTIQSAGWATFSSILSYRDNNTLDLDYFKSLVDRVERTIHKSPNRSRYAMNGFVIAMGTYVPEFTEEAKEAGERIGKVEVNVGNTACKVPYVPEYIKKVEKRGSIGKKRKDTRC